MVEMNEEMIELKLLQQKAKYFYDNKKVVHVKLKNGNWDNGHIKDFFDNGFKLKHLKGYIIPCFYLQIEDITIWNLDLKEGDKK